MFTKAKLKEKAEKNTNIIYTIEVGHMLSQRFVDLYIDKNTKGITFISKKLLISVNALS